MWNRRRDPYVRNQSYDAPYARYAAHERYDAAYGRYDAGYSRHDAPYRHGRQMAADHHSPRRQGYRGESAPSGRRYPARGDSGRYPARGGYGGDYWWLGEHELARENRLGPYDEQYRRFSERNHPRYSPVGGMYPPVGGGYSTERMPRPLREPEWFSEWTRWF